MMKTLSWAVRPVLLAAVCASLAACANEPPRQTTMDYRSPPPSAARGPNDASGQRLTIKAGEGEKLNLPWFVRDTQEWINSN